MRAGWAAAAAALAIAGAAQGAGTKTVTDWTAVCSNLGDCAAFGFSPEDAEGEGYLMIQREAGPAAPARVTVVYDRADKQPDQTWALRLDRKPIAGVGPLRATGSDSGASATLAPAVGARLIEALRNGQSLELTAAGKSLAQISLAGSAGTLLWVDDQQGRVGTVTALARKGPAPASSVRPRLSPPLIRAAAPVSQAGLPKRAPTSLTKADQDCDLTSVSDPDDIVARLAPGVVLWGPECAMGAYNQVNIFFLGDEHGVHVKRLVLPDPPGADEASDDELINASFDPRTQTLSSFSKGRGIADCGSVETWVWDGKAFQMASEDIMPECRGVSPDDWPALYVSRQK